MKGWFISTFMWGSALKLQFPGWICFWGPLCSLAFTFEGWKTWILVHVLKWGETLYCVGVWGRARWHHGYSFSPPEEVTNWTCLRRHLLIWRLTRPRRENGESRASVLCSVIWGGGSVGRANRGSPAWIPAAFQRQQKGWDGCVGLLLLRSPSAHAQKEKKNTQTHKTHATAIVWFSFEQSKKAVRQHLDCNCQFFNNLVDCVYKQTNCYICLDLAGIYL